MRTLRVVRSLSLQTVANATNMHKSQLGRIELGERNATAKQRVALAEFYGRSWDDLSTRHLPLDANTLRNAITKMEMTK